MDYGIYDFGEDKDKSQFAASVTKEAISEAIEAMRDLSFAFGSLFACLDIMVSISSVSEDAQKAHDQIKARFNEIEVAFDSALDALQKFAGVAARKLEGKQ